MKKKQRQRQIARVRKAMERWHTCLGLRWWDDITVNYHDTLEGPTHDGEQVAFRTSGRWEYLWANIDVSLEVVATRTDEQLDEDVLHELVHILLFEYQDQHRIHHLERTVCRLVQAFMWTREAGQRESSPEAPAVR
jgi:hypothetical protein